MKLKKSLTLLDLFCVAMGAMISSGLFVLPGIAYAKAGSSVILSYILAGLLCIPAVMSKAELTTAMPKAGGDYFYIMRGFGPLIGTIAGFSAWISLSLKSAFALLGMGAYLMILTNISLNLIAFWLCIIFIILNLIGIKETVKFQIFLVIFLIAILFYYIISGIPVLKPTHFKPFFSKGLGSMISCASFVFISYGGLTKIVALAEETKNPEKNLPRAMLFSLFSAIIIYTLVITVTIGVINPQRLMATLTPISDGAAISGGKFLKILIGISAFLAFISTANAGILTASRYPFGMSRDGLMPSIFQKISKRQKTPYIAILVTGFLMLSVILFLKLDILVKVASSILILLFISANAVLILFRESKIQSYRPKFRSPFYPYLQIFGIIGGFFLLIEMGSLIIFLTGIFILLGILWYKLYVQKKVVRDSALIYLLERLVARDKELTSDNLLEELKEVVLERDGVAKDRFHELIEEAEVIDLEGPLKMEDFFQKISQILGQSLNLDAQHLYKKFMERENESSTVISPGLAIPHIVIEGNNLFRILLARAKAGIIFPKDEVVHIIFVIVASPDTRNLHLKVLSAIAQVTQNEEFYRRWFQAQSKNDLKNIVLLSQRRRV